MYAVVDTGGKQAKVEKDAVIAVERLKAEVGSTVALPVLFLADGEKVLATPQELAGVSVSAEVLEHFKGDKQTVFKLRKRKGYKRTKGHRQTLTAVRIVDITIGEAPAKPAKTTKAAKPVTAEAVEKRTPAKVEEAPEAEVVKAEAAAEPKAQSKKAAAPKEAALKEKPAKGPAPATAAEGAQCEAVKSDGTRCANRAKEGSKYCGVHAKKYEG